MARPDGCTQGQTCHVELDGKIAPTTRPGQPPPDVLSVLPRRNALAI